MQSQRGADPPVASPPAPRPGRRRAAAVGAVPEIRARAESVARAGDHEHPIVSVLGDFVEEVGEPVPHLAGDGVLLGRPVQRARDHAVGALDEEGVHRDYRSCVGLNPFRQQVKRRSDIVIVVVAVLVVALLVLWAAASPMSPDHDWTDYDGEVEAGVEVRHVQPYQAEKSYRCPGCDHEIRPGEGHKVVIPNGAPAGSPPLAHRLLARRATPHRQVTRSLEHGSLQHLDVPSAATIRSNRRDVEAQRSGSALVGIEPPSGQHPQPLPLARGHRFDRQAEQHHRGGS